MLLGDRKDHKRCTEATLRPFSRNGPQFLAPHTWTDTAKAVWQETWDALQAGEVAWTDVAYVSRNNARQAPEVRPVHRVCEVPHDLVDAATGEVFHLRWRFTWSSTKATQDAARRAKVLATGEAVLAALTRLRGLLGQYDDKRRSTIEARMDQALRRAQARKLQA